MKAGKRLSIASGCEVSYGVMEAGLSFQHVVYSSVVFLSALHVEGVPERLESFEKIQVAAVTAGSFESGECKGERFLQPTWETCFVHVLYCSKWIWLTDNTLFLSAPHQICLWLCLRNKTIFIVGFCHGFSKFTLF